QIFGDFGTRWFHTGGIFAALSETTAALTEEAIATAKKHNVIVSYDLNYRPSLWRSIGGLQRAQQINRRIVQQVDVVIGNEEDFTACLGLEVKDLDLAAGEIKVASFENMTSELVKKFPNLKVSATTLRRVKSASRNDWGALCWMEGQFYHAAFRENLEVLDRVGGGDSFASGLIYGFLQFNDPQKAVEYGAAHGALAMTTPGDASMASLKEVEGLLLGSSARIQR